MKHKKISAAVVASVLVIAIALTGTFAWQSISQRVKNEADGFSLNSGGRLHDDFNGENKDIYVENYMDPADGSPIFARVRLHEYMEIGPNAGDLTGGDGTAEVIGKADAKIDDPSTWAVHTMGEDTASDDAAIHEYWKWKMGGSTVYMPTFNKNKDSLAADVNGTYEGPDGDRTTPDKYEDYIEYTLDSEAKTDIAYYDADNNTVDEGNGTGSGNGGTEGTNYTAVEETHTVQETGEGTVLSMAEWKAQGAQVGAFWVYDTDGWAYWAQAIQPGEATGLLLDGIEQELEPGGKWYYAIDAVGQFASGGDWGDAADNSGFFEDGITSDGLLVLNQAAADITITTAGGANTVAVGKTLQLNATVTLIANKDVTWTVSGNQSTGTAIDTSGLLTVGADEPDKTVLTVTAESKAIAGLTATKTITVKALGFVDIPDVTAGSTTTVTIDGVEWYVLAKEDGKALLYAKNTVGANQKFSDSTNIWKGSMLRTYLNGEWLDGTTVLKEKAVQRGITTRSAYNASTWNTTQDKVFPLSEADLFGTFNGKATTEPRDYTYGNKVLVPDINMRKYVGSSDAAWLRSPYKTTTGITCVETDGTCNVITFFILTDVRPALWVSYQ